MILSHVPPCFSLSQFYVNKKLVCRTHRFNTGLLDRLRKQTVVLLVNGIRS